ncbi:peptidylprolyl isomerase [Luteolibacter luteus]|uniref:PpiC domain-containing protein n=1 Tax=Luteolibacter luteus TaxID=2728835 RepID=A0A858RJ44_9BACT|nr:peptidylprolyl isomerase [Luteolibacter luteus]QJE97266.1 hypothetical protein HHL09_16205 [Luteolibacter luteus]
MIEHLRKYTGMIIFVIALLFVGLAFFGDHGTFGGRGTNDPAYISVDGNAYSVSEFRKKGEASLQLGGGLGLYPYLVTMGALGNPNQEEAAKQLFVNRLLVEQGCEEFGIHPGDAEVTAALKAMPVFQGQDGTFDQAKYNTIATEGIGHYGMTEKDLFELVRDSIATEKLASVIGGGLSSDRQSALESVASRDQQVTIQLARIALSSFQENLKPTDDELKTAWETKKDAYQTERKIKVTYFIAKPTYPEAKKEEPKLPDALTEEDKKKAEKEAADKKAAEDAALAEQKRTVDNELADAVDAFLADLQNSEGKDFDKLAKDNNWELVTTEFFPRSAVPPALSVNLRSTTGAARAAADFLFQLDMSKDLLARCSEALPLNDGAWLIARLDEEEEARTKTFEEAKEDFTKDYIAEHAGEALKKDAGEKAAKIREALGAGKSFADVAKEVGLEPKAHGPFKATDKLEGEADVATLFQAASTVAPGSLADPKFLPDDKKPETALFVFVEKREIVKDPARAERVNQAVTMSGRSLQNAAFDSWLKARLESAKVEMLTK